MGTREIFEIMDNFDFERVHKVMETLDWKWASTRGVPTLRDIELMAQRLLYDVVKSTLWPPSEIPRSLSTGGFRAGIRRFDGSINELYLEFIVSFCLEPIEENPKHEEATDD